MLLATDWECYLSSKSLQTTQNVLYVIKKSSPLCGNTIRLLYGTSTELSALGLQKFHYVLSVWPQYCFQSVQMQSYICVFSDP